MFFGGQVVPVDGDPEEFRAGAVNGDGVLLLEGEAEVFEVLWVRVFYTKVVNDGCEGDGIFFVAPEGQGLLDGGVAVWGEVLDKVVVCDAAGLFEP